MGWDTQINILVEQISGTVEEIAEDLYISDAKSYWGNGSCFAAFRGDPDEHNTLFFTYERRKYLPYWSVQEVSEKYTDCYFTVVASSPDFLCGPAGIVKIQNGDITDSYGFFERFGSLERLRFILENPNPELLFQVFGKDKVEERLREKYLTVQPKKWVESNYSDNLIDYDEAQHLEIMEYVNRSYPDEWQRIRNGSL